jgi:pyridinium-3,5-biscarboxylic acid mononucleotide sulfurtransferase
MNSQLSQLRELFAGMERALIAYSGGIDSSLVAKVAYDVLGDRALAVTAKSASLLPEELIDAIAIAREIGINHQIVETQELDNPNYTANPVNRCYFCKSELHDKLKPLALELGYPYIVDGVNADDLQDYRPGIQAAKERGVRSPLAELKIAKIEVREMAQSLSLSNWNKPAQPCLSSRFPYGEEISIAKLQRVGRAEIYVRKLGFDRVRVRSQGDTARIELPPEEITRFTQECDFPALAIAFRAFGFIYVTLDLEGYISGKLDRELNLQPIDPSPGTSAVRF